MLERMEPDQEDYQNLSQELEFEKNYFRLLRNLHLFGFALLLVM